MGMVYCTNTSFIKVKRETITRLGLFSSDIEKVTGFVFIFSSECWWRPGSKQHSQPSEH